LRAFRGSFFCFYHCFTANRAFNVNAPPRHAAEDNDLIVQIGDALLMLVTFGALRETLQHANYILFRLIDLALAGEPLALAEQLNRGTDPLWSVSTLMVTLPLSLVAFRIFSTRLERSPSLGHGKMFIFLLVLLVLDTIIVIAGSIPALLFTVIAGADVLPSLLKTASVAVVRGCFLTYLVSELRWAASE
jgi:hypothetical protein